MLICVLRANRHKKTTRRETRKDFCAIRLRLELILRLAVMRPHKDARMRWRNTLLHILQQGVAAPNDNRHAGVGDTLDLQNHA